MCASVSFDQQHQKTAEDSVMKNTISATIASAKTFSSHLYEVSEQSLLEGFWQMIQYEYLVVLGSMVLLI